MFAAVENPINTLTNFMLNVLHCITNNKVKITFPLTNKYNVTKNLKTLYVGLKIFKELFFYRSALKFVRKTLTSVPCLPVLTRCISETLRMMISP